TLDWAAQLGTLVDFSSPAIVNDVAYIGSDDGRLWAYPADGCGQALCTTPLWTSTSLAQIIDSPTVKNGVVYVGSQTSGTSAAGKLNAFSAAGCGQAVCSPLWQGLAGSQSILESSPAVANGIVYIGSDHYMAAFNAAGCGGPACAPLWQGTYQGEFFGGSPAVFGGRVYVGLEDGLGVFSAAGCGQPVCGPLWLDFGSG